MPKIRNIVEGFAQFCAVLRILVPKMRKIADGFAQFCGGFFMQFMQFYEIIKKKFCPNVFRKCFGLRISNQLPEFQNVNFEEGFAQFCAF